MTWQAPKKMHKTVEWDQKDAETRMDAIRAVGLGSIFVRNKQLADWARKNAPEVAGGNQSSYTSHHKTYGPSVFDKGIIEWKPKRKEILAKFDELPEGVDERVQYLHVWAWKEKRVDVRTLGYHPRRGICKDADTAALWKLTKEWGEYRFAKIRTNGDHGWHRHNIRQLHRYQIWEAGDHSRPWRASEMVESTGAKNRCTYDERARAELTKVWNQLPKEYQPPAVPHQPWVPDGAPVASTDIIELLRAERRRAERRVHTLALWQKTRTWTREHVRFNRKKRMSEAQKEVECRSAEREREALHLVQQEIDARLDEDAEKDENDEPAEERTPEMEWQRLKAPKRLRTKAPRVNRLLEPGVYIMTWSLDPKSIEGMNMKLVPLDHPDYQNPEILVKIGKTSTVVADRQQASVTFGGPAVCTPFAYMSCPTELVDDAEIVCHQVSDKYHMRKNHGFAGTEWFRIPRDELEEAVQKMRATVAYGIRHRGSSSESPLP
jgi:hypothetical protein